MMNASCLVDFLIKGGDIYRKGLPDEQEAAELRVFCNDLAAIGMPDYVARRLIRAAFHRELPATIAGLSTTPDRYFTIVDNIGRETLRKIRELIPFASPLTCPHCNGTGIKTPSPPHSA